MATPRENAASSASSSILAVQAFIAFLNTEAKHAAERSKSLRATALTIEANFNSTTTKTTGTTRKRKRSRKQQQATTVANTRTASSVSSAMPPAASLSPAAKVKRVHTAYTLFLHENYELMKKNHPGMSPSGLIGLMNIQWEDMMNGNDTEKQLQVWKSRAEQMKEQYMNPVIMEEILRNNIMMEDTDDEDDDDNDEEDHDDKKRSSSSSSGRRKASSSSLSTTDAKGTAGSNTVSV